MVEKITVDTLAKSTQLTYVPYSYGDRGSLQGTIVLNDGFELPVAMVLDKDFEKYIRSRFDECRVVIKVHLEQKGSHATE